MMNFESMLHAEGQHCPPLMDVNAQEEAQQEEAVGNYIGDHLPFGFNQPISSQIVEDEKPLKREGSGADSPRSITVAYKGKSLTPRGSPQGSRNSSFNWSASFGVSSNGDENVDANHDSRVSRDLDLTIENFVKGSGKKSASKGGNKIKKKAKKSSSSPSNKKGGGGGGDGASRGVPSKHKPNDGSSSGRGEDGEKDKEEKRVTGVRGVHQMGSRYGKRFQVRVWLKAGQFQRSLSEDEKKKRKSGGKRIHLGCFGTLDNARHAFDIVELFFMREKAVTNLPAHSYNNSPVLHFLMREVQDRTCLEDFMTVWKHIMPFRWVMDAKDLNPSVCEQLDVIREKLDKFRNRKHHLAKVSRQPQHKSHQTHQGQAQPSNLNQFLEMLVKEKKSKDAAAAAAAGVATAAGGGMSPMPYLSSHPTHHASLISGQQSKQIADLSSAQVANVIDATPLAFSNTAASYPMATTMPHDYDSTLYNQVHTALSQGLGDYPFYYH